MRIKPEIKDELVTVIAENVPPAVLRDVVDIQAVVQNFEALAKLAGEDPAANARKVALDVLEEYQKLDQVEVLVRGLLRRDPGNSKFATLVAELILKNLDLPRTAGTTGNGAQRDATVKLQAAIAKRAQWLRTPELLGFMSENEGKVCVIATESIDERGRRHVGTGTGFLVGPDLVLTARHVLGAHIAGTEPNAAQTGKRCAFFDHTEGSSPIGEPSHTPLPSRVRRVDFHPTRWLVRASDAGPTDGEVQTQGLTDIQTLRNCLDVVLIRLAQPIGNYSRRRTGGARRGWIDLPPEATPGALATDDRIIIPQHPGGHPQQIDFGRFVELDPSQTRIRYDTETADGTSGAPCFNQGFKLVGIHSAAHHASPDPKLNQAVRFDHILRLLENMEFALPSASKLWSVSDSEDKPEVIVGRATLQDWIKSADTDGPKSLADRALVVEGVQSKCGKSFSARILRAARRDLREHVIVMSAQTVPVPQSATDFLRLIATQLRIPLSEIERMPARPSDQLGGGGDGDKLDSWLSKDLPAWLGRVLGQHRLQSVDLVAEAKTFIDLQRSRGINPSREDRKLAESQVPILQERALWNRVWIVLDDVTEDTVSREIKELLPSLLGVKLTEEALDPELRRLRWVFLGWKPGFMAELASEKLDHSVVKDEDIAVCVRALVGSVDAQIGSDEVNAATNAVRFALIQPGTKADYENLEKRLSTLQSVIGSYRDFLLNDLVNR